MNDHFIVVGYYTFDTLYEDRARILRQSLNKYKILYYLQGMESLGSWYKNTLYKPTFLLKMMRQFKGLNIVYVDCDAEFLSYPSLFETIEGDIAVHRFDRAKNYRRMSATGFEVLSGTIFLRNNSWAVHLLEKWQEQCAKNPKVWDQKLLEKVLEGVDYTELPAEYCKIFDRMNYVKEPVIVHYQASRDVRRLKGRKGSLRLK